MTGRKKKMYILYGTVLVGLGLFFWWGSRVLVGESRLTLTRDEIHFPEVSGYNLVRQEFIFPEDFEGKYNLVIIPFLQRQQADVNTWIPAAQELERTFPDLIYYELPTINARPVLSRTLINEGMRAGIPDQTARERTITFYLDKSVFKSALGISSEAEIQLFLVDRQGSILWQEIGLFSTEKVLSLEALLKELQETP